VLFFGPFETELKLHLLVACMVWDDEGGTFEFWQNKKFVKHYEIFPWMIH
jgi:hypothetical protein